MTVHVASSEARATLPGLIDRVEAGEQITLTRHGRPVAVLVSPDVVRHRRVGDLEDRMDVLGEVRALARTPGERASNGLSIAAADRLVAAVRADRDRE